MEYMVEKTAIFEKWLNSLKDRMAKIRIARRIDSIKIGCFGDHKQIDSKLFELRMFFGPGYRVYYTIQNRTVILLLTGGDKNSQKKDIEQANKLLKELEE